MDSFDSTPNVPRQRIDLTRDVEVAYWCRLLDIDHCQLRRAVQQVGPQADAVFRYLASSQASQSRSS